MKRLAAWLGILCAIFFFGMNGLAFAGQSPSISLYVNNTTGVASGVASDPDRPGQSIRVDFYINAPWPSGTKIGQTYTNSYGQYSWQLPSSYQNGVTYALYAYAIDSADGHGITSTSFTWEMPRYSPTISLYVNNSTGVASGIATDQDRPGQSLRVDFYIDGDWSSGTFLGSTYTSGSGQYAFQISSAYQDGQNHYVYAYAIDNTDGHGVAYTSFTWQIPNLYPPQGNVNDFHQGDITITGWAQDQDYPSAALQVGMRIDGVWQAGSTANPGFSFSIPSQYLTGGPYSVQITVKDAVESTWYVLGTKTIDHNLHDPEGVVHPYQPGDTTVTGWAQDQDDLSVAVRVSLKIDGEWKAGMWANGSENGGHGFSFDISPYLDNDSHTVQINVRDAFETIWYVLGIIPITSPPTIVSLSVDSTVSTCVASGRAYDPDRPLFPLALEFYIDGNRSSGTFLGSTDTDESTELFSFDIPYTYQNGVSHTLFVYAIDSLDGDSETSTSFTWVGDSPTIELSLDPETCVVSGTAYDPNLPDEPITIHFYLDDPWPAQTKIGDTSTDSSTTQFSWEIPLSYQDGEEHILHVYAIDHINGHGVAWTSFDCGEDGQCTTISLSLDDSTGVVSGTASDPDRPETPITIDFYIDGIQIDQTSTDTSGQFSWTIPNQETYRDGEPHTLVAIAIDDGDCDGEATISFTWEEEPPDSNIVGEVDEFQHGETTIDGWTQDQNNPSAILQVRLWIDSELIEEKPADESTNDGHGYSFNISAYLDNSSHYVQIDVKDTYENDWYILGTTYLTRESGFLVGAYFYPGGWVSENRVYYDDVAQDRNNNPSYTNDDKYDKYNTLELHWWGKYTADQDYYDSIADTQTAGDGFIHTFRQLDWQNKFLFDAESDVIPPNFNYFHMLKRVSRFKQQYGHLFGWSDDTVMNLPLSENEGYIGYSNRDDPDVVGDYWQEQIDKASEHGVDFFAYEVFWNYDENIVKKIMFSHLDDGFLQAGNRNKMRFAFLWLNHKFAATGGGQNYDVVALQTFIDEMDEYFQLSNYLKIDGKPVLYFYNIDGFKSGLMTDDNGEMLPNAANEVFSRLNTLRTYAMSEYGYDLYLVGLGTPKSKNGFYQNCGFDAITNYSHAHYSVDENYSESIADSNMINWWDIQANSLDTDTLFQPVVHVNISEHMGTGGSFVLEGMDIMNKHGSTGLAHPNTIDVNEDGKLVETGPGSTPKKFGSLMKEAIGFTDPASNDYNPKSDGIILVHAWNEWVAGSVLEPTQQFGWGYLEALSDAVNGGEIDVSPWPTGTISASPNRITGDGSTTISWDTFNCPSARIYYRKYDEENEVETYFWEGGEGTKVFNGLEAGNVYTFKLYKGGIDPNSQPDETLLLDTVTVVAHPDPITDPGETVEPIDEFGDGEMTHIEPNNVHGLEESEGLLKFYTNGGSEYDPAGEHNAGAYVIIKDLSINTETYEKIQIRMKVIHGYNTGSRVKWKIDSTWHELTEPLFNSAVTSYEVGSQYNDGRWYVYEIDTIGSGTLSQVLIEPVIQDYDVKNGPPELYYDGGALIEIDYIVATP